MSDIFVDVKGNMSAIRPDNGRSFTISELNRRLSSDNVDVVDLGNFYLACNPQYKCDSVNRIATMWRETSGDGCEVFGPAILIEKEHYGETDRDS